MMSDVPKKPRLKDYPFVLVVEGYGDLLFYAEALEFVGLHGNVFIKEFTGANDLKDKIETYLGRVAQTLL